MGKAIEITIWKPHAGKREQNMKRLEEFKAICLKAGVSSFEVMSGAAGKDVGNIVVVQEFKGLADNGSINEAFGSNPEVLAMMKKYSTDIISDLVSHDLYEME